MQSEYPPHFEREMGYTLREWLAVLPRAMGPVAYSLEDSLLRAALSGGSFEMQWQELSPRRIALIVLPRLHVQFRFEAVDPAARLAFMKRFDLCIQRGGG